MSISCYVDMQDIYYLCYPDLSVKMRQFSSTDTSTTKYLVYSVNWTRLYTDCEFISYEWVGTLVYILSQNGSYKP